MHPIIKTSYLFAESRSSIQGAGFVLETIDPWYIGRVLTFKDADDYLASLANSTYPCAVVPGYMILVQFAGSLVTGTRIGIQDITHAKIENCMQDMAAFYQKEKIELHVGYYKRYLIPLSK